MPQVASRRGAARHAPPIAGPNAAIEAELARAYWGAGEDKGDDVAAVERDLSQLVRDKVRSARRKQAFDEASAIVDGPGDGGDGVAAEAWRNAHEATKVALETQRQEASEARAAAKDAGTRMDQARQEGIAAGLRVADREVAAVREAAEAKAKAEHDIAAIAMASMERSSAAVAEAARQAGEARAAAAEDRASFWQGIGTRALDRIFGTGAVQAPSPAPQATLADQLKGIGDAFRAIQGVAGIGQPVPESAVDFRIKELTKAQVAAAAEQSGAVTRFLENHVGPFLKEQLPGIVSSFKSGGGEINGIPAAPPPKV